ncbi:MAG: sugar phosphate isomerase/epimerase [Oscillospiraceae bacterium]|jgi:sugar phosphate isomerase/epimerase|nr:sugar phosphate isomerase/epimerase [Oscillospiraceae bacterium]
MKLGVFTVLLGAKPLDEACEYLKSQGVGMVEIGTGGFPGTAHADPEILLNHDAELQKFQNAITKNGLEISALSCHGNAVHPNKETAAAFQKDFENCILLAEKLGVGQINTFSGCPGDHPGAKYSNWVTCPWPDDFLHILNYQWNDVLIPYWKDAVKFAKSHGVNKIGLELHPGFCVYNTMTLLKLREAVGEEIGANLDPSHLVWQGMDIPTVIRALGDAIFHFHAKDTKIDKINIARNGVLDTGHYGDEINRSWVFRSVGYGNDYAFWKDVISNLRMVGYDYAISIEHEDSLMSVNEGLSKAIEFLKQVITFEDKGAMWWA